MDQIRIVVPGTLPRKNDRTDTKVVKAKKGPRAGKYIVLYYPTAAWKDWIARLSLETSGLAKIERGAWAIRVWQYCEKWSHLDGGQLHVGNGDVDSSTSPCLDSLKAVGVIDDDARFVDQRSTKHYDRANPRLEILLTRVDSAQLDLAGTVTTGPASARTTRGKGKRLPAVPRPDPTDLDDF